MLPPSPVALAFPHIPWDNLGSLFLSSQELAVLRMAETNPIEYTLAESREAGFFVRVLLKILADANHAGAGYGHVSTIDRICDEASALEALKEDALGVVCHYAVTKLHSIISTLMTGTIVTVGNIFYGPDGALIEQWTSLWRIIKQSGKNDKFAQSGAALCLSLILVSACPSMQVAVTSKNESKTRSKSYASAVEPLEQLTAWIVGQLKSATGSLIGVVVPSMTALMAATETRHLFSASGGIKYLARQLRTSSSSKLPTSEQSSGTGNATVQQLYELTFCLWCMTYELNGSPNIRADFARDGAAVDALTVMVSTAPREKVVRVALSALVNLANCTSEEAPEAAGMTKVDGGVFLTDMLACKLLKSIQFLEDRQFTDPDIVEDIKTLHKLLADNYKEMSRWEVYKTEVESGHLQWGSTHTEAFFKENARMIEGKDSDFKLLKVLIALLSSKDDEIAAIACNDIGEFVRFYPNGKAIAKRLGAKELVMPLIEHENVELQRHALQCVSKMMVQNWEYVK